MSVCLFVSFLSTGIRLNRLAETYIQVTQVLTGSMRLMVVGVKLWLTLIGGMFGEDKNTTKKHLFNVDYQTLPRDM